MLPLSRTPRRLTAQVMRAISPSDDNAVIKRFRDGRSQSTNPGRDGNRFKKEHKSISRAATGQQCRTGAKIILWLLYKHRPIRVMEDGLDITKTTIKTSVATPIANGSVRESAPLPRTMRTLIIASSRKHCCDRIRGKDSQARILSSLFVDFWLVGKGLPISVRFNSK